MLPSGTASTRSPTETSGDVGPLGMASARPPVGMSASAPIPSPRDSRFSTTTSPRSSRSTAVRPEASETASLGRNPVGHSRMVVFDSSMIVPGGMSTMATSTFRRSPYAARIAPARLIVETTKADAATARTTVAIQRVPRRGRPRNPETSSSRRRDRRGASGSAPGSVLANRTGTPCSCGGGHGDSVIAEANRRARSGSEG